MVTSIFSPKLTVAAIVFLATVTSSIAATLTPEQKLKFNNLYGEASEYSGEGMHGYESTKVLKDGTRVSTVSVCDMGEGQYKFRSFNVEIWANDEVIRQYDFSSNKKLVPFNKKWDTLQKNAYLYYVITCSNN